MTHDVCEFVVLTSANSTQFPVPGMYYLLSDTSLNDTCLGCLD